MYLLVLSKYFIKLNVRIIVFFKTIVSKILHVLLIPLNFLRKILLKPISFIFINLRKIGKSIIINLSKIIRNTFKISKKQKKANV